MFDKKSIQKNVLQIDVNTNPKMYCATQDATVPSLHKKIIVIIKLISNVYTIYLFNIILVSSNYYSYNILSSTKNFGIS